MQQLGEQKQSIIIKKIRGSLYYYEQCRTEGKVKSRYLAAVTPGGDCQRRGTAAKAGTASE